MHLDECYRLLELDPTASDEEVKRAHRDLTKVWHPDRFGNDPLLREKGEEKLKAINAALETILSHSGDGGWRVRSRGREMPVSGLHGVATLVERGAIGEDAEVFDGAARRWIPLNEIPELRAVLAQRRMRRKGTWALAFAIAAIVILLRRPTPAGLVIAAVLFTLAALFIARMRMRR